MPSDLVVANLDVAGTIDVSATDASALRVASQDGVLIVQCDTSTPGIGFFAKAPAAQQSTISDPTGGATQDAEARTAIDALIDLLQAYGLRA